MPLLLAHWLLSCASKAQEPLSPTPRKVVQTTQVEPHARSELHELVAERPHQRSRAAEPSGPDPSLSHPTFSHPSLTHHSLSYKNHLNIPPSPS